MAAFDEQNKNRSWLKTSGIQQKNMAERYLLYRKRQQKVIIHTTGGILEVYGKWKNLKAVWGNSFYRCHRCYLVNMEKNLRLQCG